MIKKQWNWFICILYWKNPYFFKIKYDETFNICDLIVNGGKYYNFFLSFVDFDYRLNSLVIHVFGFSFSSPSIDLFVCLFGDHFHFDGKNW